MPKPGRSSTAPRIRLLPKQRIAIEVLALGKDDAAAAQAAGVPVSAVRFWREFVPAFQEEVHRQKRLVQGAVVPTFRDLEKIEDLVDGSMRQVVAAARALLRKIKRHALPDRFALRDIYRHG